MTTTKTYSELIKLPTFQERFEYLKLKGIVCNDTFGSKRWVNQVFYRSTEWQSFRETIIVRDMGCDLGVSGYEIDGVIIVHHLNPITLEDLSNMNHCVLDPENVICVSRNTHNAIHYGDGNTLNKTNIERQPNDTTLWKIRKE